MAIDDEPLALTQVKGYINKVSFLTLTGACSNASDAMAVFMKEPTDLIFVDINMPDLNGMDFIKSLVRKPLVVFTTAYSEYAVEGFRVDAVDYLLKPFGYSDFLKAAGKALNLFEMMSGQKMPAPSSDTVPQRPLPASGGDPDVIFVRAGYKTIRIEMNRILYIESRNEYVRIFLEDRKPVMTLLSLKTLEEKLPAGRFMRIHRSYIVCPAKITAIANNRIIFGKDTHIPIGDRYKDKFMEYINNKSIEKL
jgi:two-component system LytT family response regulator